jgi:hypothetical protein
MHTVHVYHPSYVQHPYVYHEPLAYHHPVDAYHMTVPEVKPVEPTHAFVKPQLAEISPSPAPGLAALHVTGHNWEAGVY